MSSYEIHGRKIEITEGDIAAQDGIDAVVNTANAQLLTGGGVAGALHRAAGPGLAEECRPYAPISPGQAVITGAQQLPNSHVIHCLGPIYGVDEPSQQYLEECYRNAIELAEENALGSIAFPAISTGAFGYPFEPATRTALKTVCSLIPQLQHLKIIRFVLFSRADKEQYERLLPELCT